MVRQAAERPEDECDFPGKPLLFALDLVDGSRPWSRRYRVHARRITTSRADKTTSSTTLAASPAGIQGASSPPPRSIHQRAMNNAMAATNAPKRYPELDGILAREARLCGDSAELCTCEREALGKKSFAELLPKCISLEI